MEQTEAYKECIEFIKDNCTMSEIEEAIKKPEKEYSYYYDDEMEMVSIEEFVTALKEVLTEKLADFDPEVIAVAKYFDCDPDDVKDVSYDHYGLKIYSYGREEAAIGTDEQATEAATEEIKSSLWAFNADFIAEHTQIGYKDWFIEAIKALQESKYEDANDDIEEMIEDMDEFIDDAISADGRGHFLSHYDGVENEEEVDGETYYIYRVN